MKLLLQILLIGTLVGVTLALLFITSPAPGVDY